MLRLHRVRTNCELACDNVVRESSPSHVWADVADRQSVDSIIEPIVGLRVLTERNEGIVGEWDSNPPWSLHSGI